MQFDWTTFILEILNFLVLIWILQRFLYRPVLDMLSARQQKIREVTEQAQTMRDEAEELRSHYESRLADWQQERENSRRQLIEELALLKTQEMARIKQALADEEEKLRVRNQTLLAAREAELRRSASSQAYDESAAMLKRLASPELTERIVGLFLEDLAALPENDRGALRKAGEVLKENASITVVSAHPPGHLRPQRNRKRIERGRRPNLTGDIYGRPCVDCRHSGERRRMPDACESCR